MTRPSKIISGGQTGADRAGLDAAIALGIPHSGWCPKGRKAEDGQIPDRYSLREAPSASYPDRTRMNVEEADATVVFTHGPPGSGSALTIKLAEELGRPVLHLDLQLMGVYEGAARFRDWIQTTRPRTLNVAGSRESGAPGIMEQVRWVLRVILGGQPERPSS